MKLVIDSDAHLAGHLENLRLGVWVARPQMGRGPCLSSRTPPLPGGLSAAPWLVKERGLQTWLAHRLIDAGVDVVHGHSSHHVLPIEIYGQRLVLYGCGDFINDYEGIRGYEPYRGDLRLMYFATTAPSGALAALRLVPMRSRRLRLERASGGDTRWLADTIRCISAPWGTRVELTEGGEEIVVGAAPGPSPRAVVSLRSEQGGVDPCRASGAPPSPAPCVDGSRSAEEGGSRSM